MRRFDQALMAPPDPLAVAEPAVLAAVRAWCEAGALPACTQPLRVAAVTTAAGLDFAACALDGSHELARLGRWPGLGWRLRILWRERTSAPGDPLQGPWDAGWWREGPLGPAQAFQPRRPTLLLVRPGPPGTVPALLATLRARSAGYRLPLRVLVVSPVDEGRDEAMGGVERLPA